MSRPLSSLLVLTLLASVPACGGSEDEPAPEAQTQTYVEKESTSLKNEGSVVDEKDEAKRAEERAKKNADFNALKKRNRLSSRLKKAEDDFDRAEVVGEIAKLGAAAAPLLPELEPLLESDDAELRIQVYRAVAGIGGKDASRLLRRSFEDDEEAVKAAGLNAWRKAGIADVSPALRFLDGFEDASVQRAALRLLLTSKDVERHLPTVVEKLPELSGAAVKPGLDALSKLETRVPGFAALLVALADHQEAPVRVQAIAQMGRLNEKKKAFAEILVRCLGDDPNLQVRTEAHRLMAAWAGSDDPPAYKADAEPEALEASRDAWRAWLEKNAAKFKN